jgi:hypothetical protein
MKKLVPDLLGVAGYCQLIAGLYLSFGLGLALAVGGALMLLGGYLAARRKVRP